MCSRSHDLQGNAYLGVAGARTGVRLTCDGDFTCIDAGAVLHIEADEDGLFVPCSEGRRYLDGQLSDCGQFYIGLYAAPPQPSASPSGDIA